MTVANMSTPNFRFKQFTVWHDRCAMKVGTDGVLLGAWTSITNYQSPITNTPLRVLDIGTGSGLVALMLAQRYPEAQIDAIDIDADAVAQAEENFARSPWFNRLHAYCVRAQDWLNQSVPSLEGRGRERFYSLIVSNPPFFQNSLKNPDKGREMARHTDTLSYSDLFRHSARLLTDNGQLAVILPVEAENEAISLAQNEGLRPTRLTRVFSKATKPAKRILLAFEKSESRYTGIPTYRNSENPFSEDTLVLENETGGRSTAYQLLTKDFYL